MRHLLLFTLLSLAGCASVPPGEKASQAAPGFELDGRIAVRHDSQRFSAEFHWQHDARADEIALLAPLGLTLARLHRDGSGARLESAGEQLVAPDSESLMRRVLGWHLPLDGMPYWVRALPRPGSLTEEERDDHGRLDKLRQDGWEIRYLAYEDAGKDSLPRRLLMRRENLEILLLLEEWKNKPQ